MSETLHTCPRCAQHGFSSRGLSAHVCRAGSERSRLTPGEIAQAVSAAAPATTFPMEKPNTDTLSAPSVAATLTLPADQLADHPLLAHIPVWAPSEPEFQALAASIAERGLDYPVLVDSCRRVVDGRNRRNALSSLGQPVPIRVVADADVAQIILASLGNRRHLTKSALAYLSTPLLKPAVEESRARRISFIRSGAPRSSTERTIGATAEDLAESLGIGRSSFFQALDLHKRFAANPDLRAQFEPGILSGELGLGGAIQAISGKEATQGKPKVTRDLDTLITRGFSDLRTRFTKWQALDEPTRAKVTATAVTATQEWPDDVVAATAKAWRAAGRIG